MQQISSGRFDVPRRGCQTCQGCGAGYAPALSLPSEWLPAGTADGQKIGLSFSARSLSRAAVCLFGLPLITFVGTALWFENSGVSEPVTVLFSVLALLLGVVAGGFLLPGKAVLTSQVEVVKLLNNTTTTLS